MFIADDVRTPQHDQVARSSCTIRVPGTLVVTASDDKTARVWDAATGKPLALPLKHQGYLVSAVFSPDGTRVVTASGDHTARLWGVQLDLGTFAEWAALTEQSPFVLSNGVLARRVSRAGGIGHK